MPQAPASLRLTVRADVAAIAPACEQLRAVCPAMPPEAASLVETALSEAMTNVIEHSLGGDAGRSFEVQLNCAAAGIELLIEDDGSGLSPALFAAMPAELRFDPDDLESLPESGMGIALIKSIMDEVEYTQDRGINRLRLYKRY